MKQILSVVLFLVLATACNNTNKQTESKDGDNSLLSFSIKDYKQESKLTDQPQSTIEFQIPIANADTAIAKQINDSVFEAVRLIVGGEKDASTNYEELQTSFINSYEEFKKEFPTSIGNWEVTVKGTIECHTSDVINIKLDSYLMTGGAHGNPQMASFLFDAKTGEKLAINDIVSNPEGLKEIAEKKFREKYDIPADKELNSPGLWFENNEFALPQNIFITNDGISLYYNRYEIGSYAEGDKEVSLSYEEVKDYISVKIK